MDALYAFMRHTDDLVDDAASAAPREALAQWRETWQSACAAMLRRRSDRPKPPSFCLPWPMPSAASGSRPST